MHYKKLFPSKYLRAVDFDDGELAVVIDRLDSEMVGQGADAEEKCVLYFSGVAQGLVLNLTNAELIAELYGNDTANWLGQALALYKTKVRFGKEMVDALRVKRPVAPVEVIQTPLPGAADNGAKADCPF